MKNLNIRVLFCAAFLTLSCAANAADVNPKIITYPASKDMQATVTLLKREGDVGRTTAISTGYRPQHQFSGGKENVTCAIQIVRPKEQIEPGETAEVLVNCAENFKVIEGQLGFTLFEGGRKVAQGMLRP
jgi:translation elongation factor EF-Tu-like GTPase